MFEESNGVAEEETQVMDFPLDGVSTEELVAELQRRGWSAAETEWVTTFD